MTFPFAVLALQTGVDSAFGVDAALGANPVTTVILLGLLSLVPFILMMTTSFLKFAVVLSIVRTAIGTQQVPPTPVVMGLAIVLSIYVMSPVGHEVFRSIETQLAETTEEGTLSGAGARSIVTALIDSREPIRRFLAQHAHPDEVAIFAHHAREMAEPGRAEEVSENDLLVLIPAFAISELAEAFAIGFLIFLPFLVIDMVVSNILLAMGMFMLPPVIVSLPFKLLLFIMVDGWRLLAQGLLQPYVA